MGSLSAQHPRFFQNEISARHERRIKKLFKERQKLRSETHQWLIDKIGTNYLEKLEAVRERRESEREDAQQRREATIQPALTRERTAQADRILADRTSRSHQTDTQRLLAFAIERSKAPRPWSPIATSAQPAPVAKEGPKPRQVELHLDRQPPHRLKRLEREERRQAENDLGRAWARRSWGRPDSYFAGNAYARAIARRRRR